MKFVDSLPMADMMSPMSTVKMKLAGLIVIFLWGGISRGQAPDGTVCQSHAPYFLVIRPRTDSLNSDVLVKYRQEKRPCAYRTERGDYELKDVNSNRFAKVADPYLFLGGGSGRMGASLWSTI
jgi:hypothetical protein